MGIVLLVGCVGGEEPKERLVPPSEPAPKEIVSIHVAESVTCRRDSAGWLSCEGQRSPIAAPILLPPDVTQIEAAERAICLRRPGELRCVREGVEEVERSGLVEIARGPGAAAGRDADGLVWAVQGEKEEGSNLIPVPLPAKARRVLSGGDRACAWLEDASLWCWDPYIAMSREPSPERLAEGVSAVDGDYLHVCFVSAQGAACRSDRGLSQVAGAQKANAIAVGRAHACVLVEGRVACVSLREGEASMAVPELPPAHAIDAGNDHTCVLAGKPAEVICWGR